MRSRFTAFARSDTDYIANTWAPAYTLALDTKALYTWTKQVTFTALEIIDISKGNKADETGIVEFIAHYKENNQPEKIHERSTFQKIGGRWYYLCAE